MENIFSWLRNNYIEIFGAISGLVYIYFSIKENIALWITGIITSAVYIYVYFSAKFYADMSLQFYYLFISIYGWAYWIKKSEKNSVNKKNQLKITTTPPKEAFIFLFITLLMFVAGGYLLDNYTDSPVPYWDAFTTSVSITATYMLTRKYIEQWILWIIVDFVSIILYINKGLYATVVLFFVYTVLAFVGFFQWRKKLYSGKFI